VLSVIEAIRELTRMVGTFNSMSVSTFDAELIEQAPNIEPFRVLLPAVDLVARLAEGGRQWLAGRAHNAIDVYETILEHMAAEDRAGLDPQQHARIRMGLTFAVGLYEATRSLPSAEQRAALLESDPSFRVNAWLVRTVLQLNRGQFAEARASTRRAELLRLQEGAEARYLTSTAAFEGRAYASAGDAQGLQRVLETIRTLAARLPHWQPVLAWAESVRLRFEGDHEAALATILPALEVAQPGRHPYFTPSAALHVELLCELGRSKQAAQQARDYLEAVERHQLAEMDGVLRLAAARAFTEDGDQPAALALLEHDIAEAQAAGRHGLALGLLYEARAQVALAAGESAVFTRYAELTAHEYGRGESAVLRGRLARLIEQARQRGLTELGAVGRETEELLAHSEQLSEMGTVRSRLEECADAKDRAQCALTLLLQAGDSYTGHLYGVDAGRVSLLASLSDEPAHESLQEWAERCVQAEVETTGQTTGEDKLDVTSGPSLRFTDESGSIYEHLPLISSSAQLPQLAALLVRRVGPRRVAPSRALQSAIADQLLSHRDVTGIELSS